MRTKRSQSGFAVVEIAILAVVVVVLGLVAFKVYTARTNSSSYNAAVSKASSVPSAPVIHKTSDLNTAESTVDSTSIDDSSDTAALDSDSSGF
jgi:Tfp pilus assembly protein PilE